MSAAAFSALIISRVRGVSNFYFLNYDVDVAFCETTGEHCNQSAGYGLKIPCVFKFYGRRLYVVKLKELLTADS